MTALISRLATAAGILALASACTMKNQDAPPLTGPSEFSQSITISVTPDVLPQDGASQSFITISARDANAQPIRNLTMRTEVRFLGELRDFGVLSARSVVTGSDGRATLVYTAPFSPPVSDDALVLVEIVVTPSGTDYGNSVLQGRTALIRLVPQGTVIPQGDLVPDFTVTPASPTDNQTVLFDASSSEGTISEYQWNFGDGGRASGRAVSHAFQTAGTYVVTLTLVDPYGRSASTSQSVTVTAAELPTAAFTFSPTAPRVGTLITLNASTSRAPAGSTLVSYTWEFGDGSPRVTTSTPLVTKVYATAGTYTVNLIVTDNAGRTHTTPLTIAVLP